MSQNQFLISHGNLLPKATSKHVKRQSHDIKVLSYVHGMPYVLLSINGYHIIGMCNRLRLIVVGNSYPRGTFLHQETHKSPCTFTSFLGQKLLGLTKMFSQQFKIVGVGQRFSHFFRICLQKILGPTVFAQEKR